MKTSGFFIPDIAFRTKTQNKEMNVEMIEERNKKLIVQAAFFTAATGVVTTFFFTHINSSPLNSNEFIG